MPIMRIKEMRDSSSEERTAKLSELRTELLRLKTMIGAGGNIENPARIRELRKTVARLLTIEAEQKRLKPAKKQPEPKKTAKSRRRKKDESNA